MKTRNPFGTPAVKKLQRTRIVPGKKYDTVVVDIDEVCKSCGGSEVCQLCDGCGEVDPDYSDFYDDETCPDCDGEGHCKECEET